MFEKRRKIFLMLLVFLALTLTQANIVSAHCPLCSAAAGAGVAAAQYYGVDLLIVGLWLGFFITATSLWGLKLLPLSKQSRLNQLAVITAVFLSFIIPFRIAGLLEFNHLIWLFGSPIIFNRMLAGMLVGVIIGWIMPDISHFIKKYNGNKSFIPFQAIVLTVSLLSIISIFVYFW